MPKPKADPNLVAPKPAVTSLDGWSIRRIDSEDFQAIADIYSMIGNQYLLDLPPDPQQQLAFLESVMSQTWGLALTAAHDGVPKGFAATGPGDLNSLNSYFLTMFADPSEAEVPLAMFVRHVFWNFSARRLFLHCPVVEGTEAYLDLYPSVAFEREGLLRGHRAIGGHRLDVAVFGVLREEFERWCEKNHPELAL